MSSLPGLPTTPVYRWMTEHGTLSADGMVSATARRLLVVDIDAEDQLRMMVGPPALAVLQQLVRLAWFDDQGLLRAYTTIKELAARLGRSTSAVPHTGWGKAVISNQLGVLRDHHLVTYFPQVSLGDAGWTRGGYQLGHGLVHGSDVAAPQVTTEGVCENPPTPGFRVTPDVSHATSSRDTRVALSGNDTTRNVSVSPGQRVGRVPGDAQLAHNRLSVADTSLAEQSLLKTTAIRELTAIGWTPPEDATRVVATYGPEFVLAWVRHAASSAKIHAPAPFINKMLAYGMWPNNQVVSGRVNATTGIVTLAQPDATVLPAPEEPTHGGIRQDIYLPPSPSPALTVTEITAVLDALTPEQRACVHDRAAALATSTPTPQHLPSPERVLHQRRRTTQALRELGYLPTASSPTPVLAEGSA